MISIATLGNGAAAAEYYLRRQAGCELDYYTGQGERRGVWCGAGSRALGLTGEFSVDGERDFRALLAGYGPDGVRLVEAVLRLDPAAKLDARPLVDAVRRTAAVRGCDVAELLHDDRVAGAFAHLARQVDRSTLATVRVRADVAEQIAQVSSIDPAVVYGDDRFAEARSRVGQRVDVRRGGFDVVFSAPKSVSVLYGLVDDQTADQVRAAHAAAMAEALAYLERHVARAARGHQGDGVPGTRIATEGLLAAAFEHRSSRADDPQLHTHVVIANMVCGVDGRWSATNSRALYLHELTASYVYQAVLRGELTRRLGVAWGEVRRGIAEIDGVPRPLCRAFSQRRQAIEARLAGDGREGAAAARQVCEETRPVKSHLAEQTLREQWAARALALGFDPASVRRVLGRVSSPVSAEQAVVAERLLAPDGLTGKRSVFDTQDVLRGVCEAIPAGASVDLPALLELAHGVVRRDEAVPTLAPIGQRTWSTQELLSTELAALDLVAARREEGVGVVSGEVVAATLTAYELVPEQVALVRALTTSGAGVDVVVGPAGAGKTHALRAAREAWERAGHPVLGTALAAIAARELERGAGIRAMSLARLLGEVDRGGLPDGAVLVVDEASMVGTRQLACLLGAASAARAKVVLVGDPCQLPEIEAGGLFSALARTPAAITLTDNQRQAEPWERDALIHLRNGDVETALVAYAAQDRVHLAATVEELNKRIVADLLVARCEPDGADAVILTSRRVDATRLNAVVREYLRAHGLLGETEIQVGEAERPLAFSTGDEVVVTRNDYARGLLNGTRGLVSTVDPRGRWLQLTTRDGATVRVGAAWAAGRLDHAYAITCHRAQGMTIDTALLYGTAALCREAGYVAMSRGRRANHVYASADSHDTDQGCDIDEEVMKPPDETRLVEQAAGELTEMLTKSRRQRLAHEQLPDRHLVELRARGDELPRSSVRGFSRAV